MAPRCARADRAAIHLRRARLGLSRPGSRRLAGLTPTTDPAAIYRALLESIAYSFAAVDERLAGAVPGPLAIVASGGALNHSPLLAQVIADSLGREIAVAGDVEASRRGAALAHPPRFRASERSQHGPAAADPAGPERSRTDRPLSGRPARQRRLYLVARGSRLWTVSRSRPVRDALLLRASRRRVRPSASVTQRRGIFMHLRRTAALLPILAIVLAACNNARQQRESGCFGRGQRIGRRDGLQGRRRLGDLPGGALRPAR